MRKLIKNLLSLALVGMVVVSCGNPTKMAKNADQVSVKCDPQTLEVVADKIVANVTVNFPNEFFHPKGIVEVTPVLVYQGGEATGKIIMLQGEKVTENYKTVPVTGAAVAENFEFDYKPGMEKSHLELRMTVIHKDKRVPFASAYKVADGANTTYKLVKTCGALAYAPDAYQAIIPEQGEAQILYLINSASVRPSQLKSDEVKAFQDFLKNVKADERREIKNTTIVSYASPDGKYELNEKLSAKRAETANKAFTKTINKKVGVEAPVVSESISEDWDGFKELVENSNIEDKDLIIRVLEMYSDPAVREREIKNMSQVFSILAKEVLPQLRRARFIANIDFKNYTDEELVALVDSNIEILDEEALLHAATLIEANETKASIYNKAINKFSSNRAMINAAVTYLKMEKVAEAKAILAKVSEKTAYYYNTVGVIALRNNDLEGAKSNFSQSNIKEAQYNLSVLDVINGKYADAAKKIAGANNFNEALISILNNDLAKANSILKDSKCACSAYLKAIVAARQGKVEEAKAALEIAKKGEYKDRIANDIEFAKVK